MKGKRYGDNPKYIADEIIRQKLDYEIVWLMKDEYDVNLPKAIRKGKYNLFSIAYELATAKFWIDSNTKQYGILKRKNQYYIQTWHGSYGLKKIFGDIPDKLSFFDKQNIKYNTKIQDLMISNSKSTTEIYRRAFGYRGEILECGSPRNDIFFEDKEIYVHRIQNFFHLQNKKIVLYAPTYREDFRTADMHLDFRRLLQNLRRKFGGEWVVLVRLHQYNMIDAEHFIHYNDTIINATGYSVMQELLMASDILISDYSSCILDFVTRGKVCFLYATDVKKYKSERDMYFDIYKLPFPLAENNDELERNILGFQEEIYQKKLKQLFEQVNLYDKGNACKQVVDWIVRHT
ncbi:MAG: CDP-glycerol glycerophosphotransferase family protein [Blautia sp.]|nr:CDP-glycerol glycerophosphotransferase family protein [Blautia sp.]